VAQDRAESLANHGATLSLMPLVGPGEPPFELSPFWAELMRRGTPADPVAPAAAGDTGDAGGGGGVEEPPAPAPALQELLDERVWPLGAFSTTVRAKAFKKRALTRLSWVLGPAGGAAIGLRLHKLLAPAWPNQRAAGAVWFDALDNVALKPSTAAIAQDTGERVPPEAPRRFWPKPSPAGLAPRLPRIFLSREEERELRAPVPKGLRLLGFRPLAAVAPAHALEPPLFAYPDEAGAPGSTRAFSAVLAAMLARRVAALCVLVRGPAAYPRLVHALPQAEERGEYGEQLAPPGLWLLPAPFADELRAPERERGFAGPHPDAAAPTEAAVAAAEAAVRALALPDDFDSAALPNPHLQRHFQVVEALALARPVPPPAADATLEAGAEARAAGAPAVQAFKDAVYGPGYTADMAPPAGSAKRKAAGGAPAPVSAEEAAAVEALRVPAHAADGTLAKLKADDLKRYCAAHGLPRSGNKGDLAARIEAHLERAAAPPPPAAKAASGASA
jgi:ATP-dependent DNA helicase 2 subunit 1